MLAGVEAAPGPLLHLAAGVLDLPLPQPRLSQTVYGGAWPRGEADLQGRRRGYQREDREWLSSLGSASGYLSVLVLALYINSDQVIALYSRPLLLWLVCPLLLYWIGRMWLLAFRDQIHEDPIVATVRDPTSYVVGVLVGLTLYAAL